MKFTDQDKVSHYVNNLKQLVLFWHFEELHRKVNEVEHDQEFRDFCVRKHDEWHLQVGVLYLYFLKKEEWIKK